MIGKRKKTKVGLSQVSGDPERQASIQQINIAATSCTLDHSQSPKA